MRPLKKPYFLVGLNLAMMALLFNLGCGSLSRSTSQAPRPPLPPEATEQFEQALAAMEREEYFQAAQQLEDLKIRYPGSEFDLVIAYNLAAAHEGLGDCERARDSYQDVARSSRGRNERLEALSLFRLSYAFECLGQDQKVIASLLDARAREEFLTEEIRLTEVPARLALAYSRLGEAALAEQFFREAEQGIQRLIAQGQRRTELAPQLARTLYFMGRRGPRQQALDPQSFLQSLSHRQKYLLRSVELDVPQWSDLAAQEILGSYERVWQMVQTLRPEAAESPALAQQSLRRQRVDILTASLKTLNELKQSQFPDENPPQRVGQFQRGLGQHEARMHNALARLGVKTLPTPEAERREGLRREGRVRAAEPSPLEQERTPP